MSPRRVGAPSQGNPPDAASSLFSLPHFGITCQDRRPLRVSGSGRAHVGSRRQNHGLAAAGGGIFQGSRAFSWYAGGGWLPLPRPSPRPNAHLLCSPRWRNCTTRTGKLPSPFAVHLVPSAARTSEKVPLPSPTYRRGESCQGLLLVITSHL